MSGWKCLSTYRACASRGLDSRPHVNREGEEVGTGVSLVRTLCCIFGHRLAKYLNLSIVVEISQHPGLHTIPGGCELKNLEIEQDVVLLSHTKPSAPELGIGVVSTVGIGTWSRKPLFHISHLQKCDVGGTVSVVG
jgi:hypothetical protein